MHIMTPKFNDAQSGSGKPQSAHTALPSTALNTLNGDGPSNAADNDPTELGLRLCRRICSSCSAMTRSFTLELSKLAIAVVMASIHIRCSP